MILDGDMSITQNLWNTILICFPSDRFPRVLEIGSGKGTANWVEAGYTVDTVEHDKKWVNSVEGATYFHSELIDGYYDRDMMKTLLEKGHDIWLLDGPPGMLGGVKGDRTAIKELLHQGFSFPKVIIVDDTQREDGLDVCHHLMAVLPQHAAFRVERYEPGKDPHHATIFLMVSKKEK